jgi:hypothetical protein
MIPKKLSLPGPTPVEGRTGTSRLLLCGCTYCSVLLSIREVCHKFSQPGHSFLPNDSDFGDIEKKMKYQPEVYVPTQWYDIIEKSRVKKNKFEVIKMERNYFKNTAVIEENMVNRKKTDSGDKVEWLKIKEMRFKMEAPGLMEYKYAHNSLVSFDSVNLNKRWKGRPSNLGSLILTTLYRNGTMYDYTISRASIVKR